MSTTSPTFRPSVLAARARLAEGREEIKQQHLAGSPGIQISTRLADLLDGVVLDLFEARAPTAQSKGSRPTTRSRWWPTAATAAATWPPTPTLT